MTNKQDIIKFLDLQEKNLEYYKKYSANLEKTIEQMRTIHESDKNWINPDLLNLEKLQYSKEEIQIAFKKTKIYEGLDTNEFSTVLDTFIKMLEGKHHSQKK